MIKRLSTTFALDALLAICKSFIRPRLDYADIIVYNKPNNDSIKMKNVL